MVENVNIAIFTASNDFSITISINIFYTECVYTALCLVSPLFLAYQIIDIDVIIDRATDDLRGACWRELSCIENTNTLWRINDQPFTIHVSIPNQDLIILQADENFARSLLFFWMDMNVQAAYPILFVLKSVLFDDLAPVVENNHAMI